MSIPAYLSTRPAGSEERRCASPWLGGFIRETEAIYVIRKRVDGTRYEVSTRCHTERAALKQLERFEADPERYTPGGAEKRDPVQLTAELVEAFLAHSRDVKKNSATWRYQQKMYLAWWASKLKGVDLGRASLRDQIEPALEGASSRQHRIATIKAFYSWLRKVKRVLTLAEDPTFASLTVQARPGARAMRDKSIPKEHYLKARVHLAEHWRAAMDVQAGTAWHPTEVSRFAASGSIEDHPMKAKGVAGVLVCPEAKGGGELRTPVSAEVRAAAELLLERGIFGIQRYSQAVKAACEAAGVVPPFTPGRFRHSVSTWAINMGTDPAQVSAFLNHKDGRTTRKFYATHAVVTKIPTLI